MPLPPTLPPLRSSAAQHQRDDDGQARPTDPSRRRPPPPWAVHQSAEVAISQTAAPLRPRGFPHSRLWCRPFSVHRLIVCTPGDIAPQSNRPNTYRLTGAFTAKLAVPRSRSRRARYSVERPAPSSSAISRTGVSLAASASACASWAALSARPTPTHAAAGPGGRQPGHRAFPHQRTFELRERTEHVQHQSACGT